MYAAGGLNAFVCNTIFLGFDQFSFWRCMGSRAHSRVLLDAKLAAGDSPLPGPRRPVLQRRRHARPRHRPLESRRVLVPAVGGLRVRRAHDHDQRAQAAA
jgi:hypothetical protein